MLRILCARSAFITKYTHHVTRAFAYNTYTIEQPFLEILSIIATSTN